MYPGTKILAIFSKWKSIILFRLRLNGHKHISNIRYLQNVGDYDLVTFIKIEDLWDF